MSLHLIDGQKDNSQLLFAFMKERKRNNKSCLYFLADFGKQN